MRLMGKEELEKELERKQRLIKKALTILGEPNGKTKEVVVAGSEEGMDRQRPSES